MMVMSSDCDVTCQCRSVRRTHQPAGSVLDLWDIPHGIWSFRSVYRSVKTSKYNPRLTLAADRCDSGLHQPSAAEHAGPGLTLRRLQLHLRSAGRGGHGGAPGRGAGGGVDRAPRGDM